MVVLRYPRGKASGFDAVPGSVILPETDVLALSAGVSPDDIEEGREEDSEEAEGGGGGDAKHASGSGSDNSYSVGRCPEMVAHRSEPVRSNANDETVGYAYRCDRPEPRVKRVWYCKPRGPEQRSVRGPDVDYGSHQ